MIIGAHVMVQSRNDAADKAFFRDVLKLPSIDAGGGFLLYAVPPTEIAIHEGDGGSHELFLMVDDIETFVADMRERDIDCSPAQNRGWGIMTQMTLPGGGRMAVYQPLHKRPKAAAARTKPAPKRTKRKAATSAKKKTSKRPVRKATPRRAKARRR